jgi:M6 family metalloprotease-like protein
LHSSFYLIVIIALFYGLKKYSIEMKRRGYALPVIHIFANYNEVKMKRYSLHCLIFILLFLSSKATSQTIPTYSISADPIDDVPLTTTVAPTIGKGYTLPSEGLVNILVVFAQFSDDNWDVNNAAWPKGSGPANMSGWVDQTWTSTPTAYSLTDYFNQMSLGKLKVTGKEVSVIAPNTRAYYLANNKKRSDIQKEILQQLDQTIDFGEFDKWTRVSNYNQTNQSDGNVDMIMIIWRNIASELSNASTIRNSLDFWTSFGSLGSGSLSVDNGARTVKFGDLGSGVTVRDYTTTDIFKVAVHEFAHYLLGGNEFHNGYAFWSMLSTFETRSYMISAYERYRLGWGNVITINKGTTQTITDNSLGDFITTGKAYRVEIDAASGQWFYIENHQKLNRWDYCTKSIYPEDKGIFVLRQDWNPTTDDPRWMYMVPAGGRYTWSVNQVTSPSWYSGPWLPVFKKGAANRDNGYHAMQLVPYIYQGVSYSPDPIIFEEDASGNVVETNPIGGIGNDAFRIDYKEVFSPWVNPNTQRLNRTVENMGFYLNSSTNGVYSISFYMDNPLTAPPSKPQTTGLSWVRNSNSASASGDYTTMAPPPVVTYYPRISWNANPEPNITQYEIYRRVNGTGSWVLIKRVSSLYCDDLTWPESATLLEYEIRAQNGAGKTSLYSEIISTNRIPKTNGEGFNDATEVIPDDYALLSNYPNPFNPSTTISFDLPEDARVTLKVYDMLGKEISVLAEGTKSAGRHTVNFNASHLPSGVYIYRFTATSLDNGKHFEKINKMMFLK